ncbi:ATP-grasp domain-containing protein [Streptomyces mirabilis]|uniref:ATP-grasp domain-containing protein n=1 Tax=Streptomyces mirabilis TaxID=68239 RepID=UPI00224F7D1F|nr:ATP-grasp domain-containing protein [Streptomyces mirabilis]MCX5357047.1 ATP-grasp domain-containing protein [Streptomyces mirabilis]
MGDGRRWLSGASPSVRSLDPPTFQRLCPPQAQIPVNHEWITMGFSGAAKGDKPLLALVYDLGAADPVRIYSSAKPLCNLLFVCDRSSPHVAEAFDKLESLAPVVDITGMALAEACDAVAAHDPAGVLTLSEHQIVLTAAIAQRCRLPFHDPQTSENLTDKLRQRQAMAAAGVQTTRCVAVKTPAEAAAAALEVGLPAVVKPRGGAGSVDTCRVDTAEQCAQAVSQFLTSSANRGSTEFVVEELLVGDPSAAGDRWGDYVSVESITHNGHTQLVCVTGRLPLVEPFREGGYVLPATVSDKLATQIVETEQAALRAIGVRHGVTHTEVKLTPEGPRVIEVNGRHGGYVGDLLQRAAGYDLVRAAIILALGKTVRVPRIRCRQVAYQYFIAPPVGAQRLLSIEGVEELSEVPGVAYMEVLAEPGQKVHWRDGTRAYVGIVYGSAANHDSVLQALAGIDTRLQVDYAQG